MTTATEQTVTAALPKDGAEYAPLAGGVSTEFEIVGVVDKESQFGPSWMFTFEVPEHLRDAVAKKKLPPVGAGKTQSWRVAVFSPAKWSSGGGKFKASKSVELARILVGTNLTAGIEAFARKYGLSIDPTMFVGARMQATTSLEPGAAYPKFQGMLPTDEQIEHNIATVKAYIASRYPTEYNEYFGAGDGGDSDIPF